MSAPSSQAHAATRTSRPAQLDYTRSVLGVSCAAWGGAYESRCPGEKGFFNLRRCLFGRVRMRVSCSWRARGHTHVRMQRVARAHSWASIPHAFALRLVGLRVGLVFAFYRRCHPNFWVHLLDSLQSHARQHATGVHRTRPACASPTAAAATGNGTALAAGGGIGRWRHRMPDTLDAQREASLTMRSSALAVLCRRSLRVSVRPPPC